jgi:hypothetical protein
VRRERPLPGAQYNLFDPNGYRHTAFLTDTPGRGNDLTALELRHRQHARVGGLHPLREATGLRNLPWPQLERERLGRTRPHRRRPAHRAQALCFDGELRRIEPATLRHRVLHTAGRLIRGGWRRPLRLSRDWPWSRQLGIAFARLRAAPWLT